MSISKSEFDERWAEQQGSLAERVLKTLADADAAYTAEDVAARVFNSQIPYPEVLDPAVEAALPEVRRILRALAEYGRAIKAVVNKGIAGPQLYYAERRHDANEG